MSSIFHCIESGCAEVRYQAYKKSNGIRYRYPGEDWITVNGDDYSINKSLDFGDKFFEIVVEGSFVSYRAPGLYYFGTVYPLTYSNGDTVQGSSGFNFRGKVTNPKLRPVINNHAVTLEFELEYQGVKSQQFAYFIVHDYYQGIRRSNALTYLIEDPYPYSGFGISGLTSETIFRTSDGSKPIETCHFTITQNDEVVHFESRNVCPEVEILDSNECELSERYETIKVEKVLYLERIEIRDQDIQGHGIGGTLIDSSPLPTECLNIYKTFTAAPPFPNNTVPTAAIFNPYEFVAQICSDVGCPPPEYTVVCRCGEECPAGTCPVFCGDHVCCHDPNTGNSVYQIPLGEYSGGDS